MNTPRQLITNQLAIDLNQNYINFRSPIISGALGRDDADSVWYSLEELESYIAFIKAEAVSKEYTIDGIRLYLGVYPDESSYGSKAGMTTIFLSPTGQNNEILSAVVPSQSPDILDIQALNFGTAGSPPIIEYPLQ